MLALDGALVPPRSIMDQLPGPVLGIDPQTTRVSLAALAPGWNPMAFTCSLPNIGPPGQRAWRAFVLLRQLLVRHDFETGRPAAIGLEVPNPKAMKGNKQRQIELQGILYAVLWCVWPDVPVFEVFPVSWKAAALGKGNGHAKEVDYVAWAQSACGWRPSATRPNDEAAALGVATWMAMKVLRER